ncbi:MAG: DUF1501 domain-containing protein [Saprospiraceae bacterium]|nr:DUF1501 domain-containing protein [Saprospiraceae bacterium]
MKRRNFLKIFPTATAVSSFAVNGVAMRSFANTQMARILSNCDGVEDRILVLIQLKGGNDGLNTFIPLNQYDRYKNLRTAIALPEANLINLDTTLGVNEQVGLHPSMIKFKEMYESGMAAMVQGVGYENMNQSHFKGTDLWMAGGDTTPANSNLRSGWMGRSLQAFYPDVVGVPTPEMPDPLGIQIGNPNPTLGFHTETEHQNLINLSGQDAGGFYSLIQSIGGAPILNIPDTEQGEELAYIMNVEQSTNLYAARISQVFAAGSNSLSPYPTTNNSQLANQLQTIARMIKGGCKTKIYLCMINGFDTHSAQINGGSPTTGDHADLLQNVAESVKYFYDDLEGLGLSDMVLTCTFSEFGRCAAENGSDGTDHGTLAPMMVFGKNVKAGVLGTNVNLNNLTNDNQLQGLQHDYRQVFATLLQDWLGANEDVMTASMFSGYGKLNLVDDAYVVASDCYWPMSVGLNDPYLASRPFTAFPNPASSLVEVIFENAGQAFEARLTLHSLGGSLISGSKVVVNQGNNVNFLDVSSLPPGPYFIRLENVLNGKAEVLKLMVAK